MIRNVIILLGWILLIGCETASTKSDDITYFSKGFLSKDPRKDSLAINYYSHFLKEFGEPIMSDTDLGTERIRLLVVHPFYNPYLISVTRMKEETRVKFKLAGDKGLERSGVSRLELVYESSSKRMDALYLALRDQVRRYDFYNAIDEPKNYTIADGITYLLESTEQGSYRVVRGKRIDAPFRGKDELYGIVDSLHALIPPGLVPDFEKARTLNDIVFPVLR